MCSGGHGLSIGSVGGRSDNTVDTVNITSNSVQDSQNAVRIKTVYDATGSVKGVTYQDISFSGITKYGIVIEQDYEVRRYLIKSQLNGFRCTDFGISK